MSTHPKREHRPFFCTRCWPCNSLVNWLDNWKWRTFWRWHPVCCCHSRTGLAWLAVAAVGCIAVRLPYLVGEGARGNSSPLKHNLRMQRSCGRDAGRLFGFRIYRLRASASIACSRQRRTACATHSSCWATWRALPSNQRMARDLHDTIGHHLTALNLHLDLASHRQGKPMHRLVARDLCAGLRSGACRGERRTQHREIDLQAALQTLCQGIPAPRVRMASMTHQSPWILRRWRTRCSSSIQEALTDWCATRKPPRKRSRSPLAAPTLWLPSQTMGAGKDSPVGQTVLWRCRRARCARVGGAMTESPV